MSDVTVDLATLIESAPTRIKPVRPCSTTRWLGVVRMRDATLPEKARHQDAATEQRPGGRARTSPGIHCVRHQAEMREAALCGPLAGHAGLVVTTQTYARLTDEAVMREARRLTVS